MAVGRKTGGRVKGSTNKATRDIKELAQKHGPDAIARAAHLMFHAESEDTQLKAAQFLADRGYGRPLQSVDVTTRRAIDDIPEEMIDAALAKLAAAGRSEAASGDDAATGSQGSPEPAVPLPSVH